MKSIAAGLGFLLASSLAAGALQDGTDCGGFTASQAATWLKAPAAQVTREVSKAGDKWNCSYAVGKAPAIAFSVAVASNARRATADLERYRDELAAEGGNARWKNKLPNGVYSDLFGAGDEAVWTDMNGMLTVRRENVTVQFTLPKGKEAQLSLGKEVASGL